MQWVSWGIKNWLSEQTGKILWERPDLVFGGGGRWGVGQESQLPEEVKSVLKPEGHIGIT